MIVLQYAVGANPLYLVVGVVLLVGSIVDLLWTALWVDGGAGPLSARLAAGTWGLLKIVGRGHSWALSLAGPLILVLTLVTWIGLIWAGWTLIFAGGERTLVPANSVSSPVTWAGRGYYVAYAMFTEGNGDYIPNGATWQIASGLTTASGMLFVTIAVSYILSVLGAVSNKRSFASSVTGLGGRSEAFVREGWDGDDLDQLDLPLDTLSEEISLLAEQHKSYPILHYYHSEQASDASAMAVAVFDDALTIMRHGVPVEHRPNNALVEDARSSTQGHLETLDEAFVDPADEPPPPPDLDRLRAADIPTVSDEEFGDALDDVAERRRHLLAMVEADAWHWPPIEEE
jgi:hypothetical protein